MKGGVELLAKAGESLRVGHVGIKRRGWNITNWDRGMC